jgi:cytochrome c oxidase cbb3-type subunit III
MLAAMVVAKTEYAQTAQTGTPPKPAAAGQGAPGTLIGEQPPPRPRQRPSAYPGRQVDEAKADRGKVIFAVNCSFCHGSDARGGEGGPNLIRSELVLNDKDGEAIAPVVQNGRIDRGMPKFELTAAQISDIAAYIHSFRVGGYDISRKQPPSILVGNATEGQTTFQRMCGS